MSKKIGIVGAGVVGLSVAVRAIQEFGEGNVDITIVSEVFYNQTLSFGAGGLWEPYQIQGTPNEKVNEWGKYALDHFLALLNSPYGAQTGIQLLSSYQLFEAGQDASSPFWKDVVLNFRRMGTSDIQSMGLPSKFVSGYTFGTVTVEGKYYLRFLMDNLKRRGVKFVQKKIFSFDELSSFNFDVIVNCTGIGALNLCGDSAVYPVRGQVLRLRAPWLNNIWFFGSSYIIPNVDSVVIGGTTQRGDFNTNVDANDTERIINDIAAVFPAIRDAPIVSILFNFIHCHMVRLFINGILLCADRKIFGLG